MSKVLYPKHLENMLEHIFLDIEKKLEPKMKAFLIARYKSLGVKTDGTDPDPVNDLWDMVVDTVSKTTMTIKLERLHKAMRLWTAGQVSQAIENMTGLNKKDKEIASMVVEKSLDDPDILQTQKEFIKNEKSMLEDVGKDYIEGIQQTAYEGFIQGQSLDKIADGMSEFTELSENKAKFWAHDQCGDVYAKYTETMHKKAGIENYRWKGMMDNHERDDHRELEGRIFSWAAGAIATGLLSKPGAKHPGEDYNCRCLAIPTMEDVTN